MIWNTPLRDPFCVIVWRQTRRRLRNTYERLAGVAPTSAKGWQESPWEERNLRCAGVLFRQAKSMFVNTLMMLDCGRAAWYGWTRGGSLFKLCAPLCSQPMRNTTILVQANLQWLTWLGLPTILLQWPELARFICPDDPECSSSHNKDVLESQAIEDWFFYHRIQKLIEAFNFWTFYSHSVY